MVQPWIHTSVATLETYKSEASGLIADHAHGRHHPTY